MELLNNRTTRICSKIRRYKTDNKFNESAYAEYVIELNFLSNAVDAHFSTNPLSQKKTGNSS